MHKAVGFRLEALLWFVYFQWMPDLLVEESIYIVVQLAAVLQPLWPSQTIPSASWPRLVGRFLQILH